MLHYSVSGFGCMVRPQSVGWRATACGVAGNFARAPWIITRHPSSDLYSMSVMAVFARASTTAAVNVMSCNHMPAASHRRPVGCGLGNFHRHGTISL